MIAVTGVTDVSPSHDRPGAAAVRRAAQNNLKGGRIVQDIFEGGAPPLRGAENEEQREYRRELVA